jgi:hypothetical protein
VSTATPTPPTGQLPALTHRRGRRFGQAPTTIGPPLAVSDAHSGHDGP